MPFVAWPEIESFHHIRKFIRVDPGEWWMKKELLHGTSTVTYKCKVKLHGTNAAVQILPDGTVLAQSRTSIITPENDNAGFARWVKANEAEWKKTAGVPTLWKEKGEFDHYLHVIFFGEWIGPGIQKGVAVSEIPKKCFAVFAMRAFGKNGEDVLFEVDPKRIALYLGKSGVEFAHSVEPNLPDVYILPWYDQSVDIDWKNSDEELTKAIAPINDWVMAIEACDPWVEKNFGVKGTGEGLVFYPTSDAHKNSFESFQNLCFKAKGEKHKNIKTAAPAQVNPETAASVDAFVELVLTPARLEQGARAIQGEHKHTESLSCLWCTTGKIEFDLKLTGKFVQWITGDIQKECGDEMAASNLDWKQVQKPLADKARSWYIAEAKIR
jgi:hypothetical protein